MAIVAKPHNALALPHLRVPPKSPDWQLHKEPKTWLSFMKPKPMFDKQEISAKICFNTDFKPSKLCFMVSKTQP